MRITQYYGFSVRLKPWQIRVFPGFITFFRELRLSPASFFSAIAYRTPLVLKGRSLYRYWNLQIIFVCGVFLSLSARLAGRKLGKLQLPHTIGPNTGNAILVILSLSEEKQSIGFCHPEPTIISYLWRISKTNWQTNEGSENGMFLFLPPHLSQILPGSVRQAGSEWRERWAIGFCCAPKEHNVKSTPLAEFQGIFP